ncbi:MAG: Clp protease N-terminal domain-containing protein, partial [Aquaspirillum sp.]
MRFDKLTTKFQQAINDAQSLALANDNPYIEPQHVLLAMLNDREGGVGGLLARAGVNAGGLGQALKTAIERLPKVSGTGGEISVSKELANLFNLTEKAALKRGDQFIASEMFLLALTEDKSETGRLFKEHGGQTAALEAAINAVRGSDTINT